MKKKVAFVATVYRHIAAFHLPFMADLQSRGCEVHAVASPDGAYERVARQGVVCHAVPFRKNPLSADNARAFLQLVRLFREQKYALVHTHEPV
mgnify:CR=1 FL=1